MFQSNKDGVEALRVVTELQSRIVELEARLERTERTLQVRRNIDLAAYNAERQAQEIVQAAATAAFADAWSAAQPPIEVANQAEAPAPTAPLDSEITDFFDLETEQMPAREWLLATT